MISWTLMLLLLEVIKHGVQNMYQILHAIIWVLCRKRRE